MQFFPSGLSPQGVVHVARFFTNEVDNFEFFLAFGHDCISGGAVADVDRGAFYNRGESEAPQPAAFSIQ